MGTEGFVTLMSTIFSLLWYMNVFYKIITTCISAEFAFLECLKRDESIQTLYEFLMQKVNLNANNIIDWTLKLK